MNLRSSLICLAIASAGASLATAAPAQDKQPAMPEAKPGPAVEAAFNKADANGDGKVSRDGVARLPAIAGKFDQLDKDKDGALTLTEFAVGYSAAG
jgi:hypothetical protein